MRRKKRVLCDDFPEGLIPRAELRRAFRELREKRLARECQIDSAAAKTRSAPRRTGTVSASGHEQVA